jgi:hypothetical protein
MGLWRTGFSPSYTVTKAYQNEAPLWKITVLGMKKHHVGAGRNILSLAHAGICTKSNNNALPCNEGVFKREIET